MSGKAAVAARPTRSRAVCPLRRSRAAAWARSAAHRHLKITEEQRQRFVGLYMAALDAVGMPGDKPFRDAVREHVEFGSRVAMQNSHAGTDHELHPLREVPLWTWGGDGQDGQDSAKP